MTFTRDSNEISINLISGLLSWDSIDCHIDLEQELIPITVQALEGEEVRNGERLIQFASENLVTEVLIHPQFNTLIQCMRNLLSSFTRHRHVVHAGYSFTGNGSWILQVCKFEEIVNIILISPSTLSVIFLGWNIFRVWFHRCLSRKWRPASATSLPGYHNDAYPLSARWRLETAAAKALCEILQNLH